MNPETMDSKQTYSYQPIIIPNIQNSDNSSLENKNQIQQTIPQKINIIQSNIPLNQKIILQNEYKFKYLFRKCFRLIILVVIFLLFFFSNINNNNEKEKKHDFSLIILILFIILLLLSRISYEIIIHLDFNSGLIIFQENGLLKKKKEIKFINEVYSIRINKYSSCNRFKLETINLIGEVNPLNIFGTGNSYIFCCKSLNEIKKIINECNNIIKTYHELNRINTFNSINSNNSISGTPVISIINFNQ